MSFNITRGAAPEKINQAARHVLYVEGSNESAEPSIDVVSLRALLGAKMRVEPLGSSFSLISVAKSLKAHHPDYWFIIDRDHWSDDRVEESWCKFPDPNFDNLLIWRRKELENYFLEPEWLVTSKYLKDGVDIETLQGYILKEANLYVYVDIANSLIERVRGELKNKELPLLKPPQGDLSMCDADYMLNELKVYTKFSEFRAQLEAVLTDESIERLFESILQDFTAGHAPLDWDVGRWRLLMGGKSMLNGLVNRFFEVFEGLPKRRVVGKRALNIVVEDLLKAQHEAMPQDLKELRNIIDGLIEL